MPSGQNPACLQSGLVNRHTVYDGIRPGKIDILEDAEFFRLFSAVLPAGNNSLRAEHQNLPRLQIPHEPGSHRFQRAAFRGRHIHPLFRLAIAQGPEAIRVSGAYQLLGGHQYKGIGSVQRVHGGAQRVLYRAGVQTLPCDDVGDGLRVAGSVEDGSGQFQRISQHCRIA